MPFDNTEVLQRAFIALTEEGAPPTGVERPDVVVGPHDWLGWAAQERTAERVVLTREEHESFHPLALKALERGGRLYAIPYLFDSVALIRNTRMTGAGPMPATMAELIAQGQDALERNNVTDGVPLALQVGAAGDAYHLWPLFASVGGSFFGLTDDGEPQPPPRWRDEFIDAFARIAELGVGPGGAGILRPDVERDGDMGAVNLFVRGRAPFLVCSSRALASIVGTDMTIDVAPVPPLGDLAARPMVSVYGFFVHRWGRNKRIAQDFVTTYMARTDTGERLNDIQPLVPVQRKAMEKIKHRNRFVRPYVTQCEQGILMPSMPQARRLWDVLGATERATLAGDDPREVAARTADEGWRLLSRG